MSLDLGIEILEGALAIGRQADPIASPMLEERMSAAKQRASEAAAKTDEPLLTTIKNLMGAF